MQGEALAGWPGLACLPTNAAAGILCKPTPAYVCWVLALLLLLQGQVVKAVIVETKKQVQRKDGRWVHTPGFFSVARLVPVMGRL